MFARRARTFLAALSLLLATAPALAQETTPPRVSFAITTTPSAQAPYTLYTVRPGDTLYRIAIQNRTTIRELAALNGIANASRIFAGQQLRIPTANTPTATPPPASTQTYVVARGDTLARIAIRFNTTIGDLSALNGINNPNLIFVGQTLRIPTPSAAPITGAAQVAAPMIEPTALPIQPDALTGVPTAITLASEQPNAPFAAGVTAFFEGQGTPEVVALVEQLGVRWVKLDVLWRDLEPVQGQIDFGGLDEVIGALNADGYSVLLTISTSPVWARTNRDENGPPDDFNTFTAFVSALAQRYAGRVQAYQIWNEPNLRREWNSSVSAIGGASYLELLRPAYAAIKAADPAATVVSAGLAPTGFNDGINAIADRNFLAQMYANGLADVSDAIGANPGGWANPPDAVCCQPAEGVLTHYEDPSFFFLDTLTDYRNLMVQAGDTATPIWVTKFGWGTSEDTEPPSAIYIFVSYTSLAEQADYLPRALELGSELGYIGPMFLYNLNGCKTESSGAELCFHSLLAPDGTPRPAFEAVRAAVSGDTPAIPPVEATAEATLPADSQG